jgi:hypothetical protein
MNTCGHHRLGIVAWIFPYILVAFFFIGAYYFYVVVYFGPAQVTFASLSM